MIRAPALAVLSCMFVCLFVYAEKRTSENANKSLTMMYDANMACKIFSDEATFLHGSMISSAGTFSFILNTAVFKIKNLRQIASR